QIPPVIWKMGKSAGALYKDILQAGTESRHCIRLMIVGPFGVGKTCLMRRLLKKGINDVKSTNGINIMVLRCKVRLSDETWIFSDELIDHAEQDRQRRLYKHLIQPRQHIPEQSSTDKITYNQTHAQSGEVKGQLQDRFDINLTSTGISSNNEYILSIEVQKAVDEKPKTEESFELNRQQETRITFQKSEEGLLKDFHGLQISAESMDDFAEVVMLDFAGQYEFYATHQTFLNKHAVYLLVLDISKDLKGSLTSEDQDDVLTDLAEIPLEDIGEYVNFWMDAIHCYSENEDSEDKSEHDLPSVFENKSEQTLPSVIVVGTCSDKLERNSLIYFVKRSGLASKVNTWGQKLPVRWIKLEQRLDILRTKDNKTVISYVDVIEHGKQVDPAIHNEKEIKLFLNYQHEMGNIIFFEDIPEYIILQPQWLVDVLKCLISAPKFQKEKQLLHSSDWIELETTGRLSEDLLTEIFSQTSLSYSVPYKYHVLKVMEKFDIIVKPSVSKGNNLSRQSTFEDSMFDQYRVTPNEELDENLESSNLNETTDPELSEDEFSDVFYGSVPDSIDYYVPSLIKTKPIRNVVENFNVTGNQCKRSSWLCMDFYFLPPAFFNHLLVGYIRRYPISIEPSKRCTKLALYRGMGVFNLDQSGCIKLAICVFCNVVQFQVWYWKEPSVERNEQVWEEAELSVNAIIRRYKMNVKYTLKIKCMSGSYNNPIGMVDVKQLKNLESYFCNDHAESHKSKDILGCWIQDEKTNKTDESLLKVAETTELEAKLNRHFQKIVNEIGPLGQILDDMISQCLISTDNRSYIEQYPDKQNQTRRLLNILIGRGQEVYSAFLEILRKHGYQKFSESLEHDHVTQENTFDNKQDLSTWKVPLFRVRLQKNYTDIVSTIKHENIVDYLITKEVFNIDDKDIIDAYPAQSDKNRKLMEKLMYTEERGYYHFLSALRKDDCYVELANQIEKTNVTSNDNLLLTDCSKLPGQDDINYR
ncbi:Hypothetical predicted protein, partial [Mytilus galloprovincialis]